jgi:hypothetical protein
MFHANLKQRITLSIVLLMAFMLSACSSNAVPEATALSPDAIFTAAALTMEANLTSTALANPTATETLIPSPTQPVATATLPGLLTALPMDSATPGAGTGTALPGAPTTTTLPLFGTPGQTPIATGSVTPIFTIKSPTPVGGTGSSGPCYNMTFIDETIPDDTRFSPGERFEKTWTFNNPGPCTWDKNVSIVPIQFSHPDDKDKMMDAPSWVNLDRDYKPGENATIAVKLKAPKEAGVYTIYWKFMDPNHYYFGTMFSVRIEVVYD